MNNNSNKKIVSEKVTTIKVDANGNETKEITETTRRYEKLAEPEYIKLYTDMWCRFNDVPEAYVRLFLSMVVRMSYCDANDLEHSQLVNTGKPWSDMLLKECGWKSPSSLKKGLQALCNCNAIRRISRGVYQINPNFAGKGLWKYNPKLKQGGIADLVATFDFKNKTVDTKIVWGADEEYLEEVQKANEGADKITREIAFKSACKDIDNETVVSRTKIS